MFTSYYVESGDFKTCVMEADPRKAALHALTNLSDELDDCGTMPRLETLVRVSTNDWQQQGMKEYHDPDVEFFDTKDLLIDLEYVEFLNDLERQEEEYRSAKPEEA